MLVVKQDTGSASLIGAHYTALHSPIVFSHLIPSSTLSGTWSSPPVSGTRPPPCAGFSLTMVDDHRAILFGGYQPGRGKSNDVYVLDLSRMVSVYHLMMVGLLSG